MRLIILLLDQSSHTVLTIVVLMVARRVECVKYPGWLRDSIYIYMPGNVVMRGVGFPAQPIFEVL